MLDRPQLLRGCLRGPRLRLPLNPVAFSLDLVDALSVFSIPASSPDSSRHCLYRRDVPPGALRSSACWKRDGAPTAAASKVSFLTAYSPYRMHGCPDGRARPAQGLPSRPRAGLWRPTGGIEGEIRTRFRSVDSRRPRYCSSAPCLDLCSHLVLMGA
jgi:hypothetical protein